MIQFSVDWDTKRKIARSRPLSSMGGRIAVGLSLICAILAFVVPAMLMNFTAGMSNDGSGPWPEAAMSAVLFGALAVIAGIGAWRQRNMGVAINTDESLLFDDGYLEYWFHLSKMGREGSRYLMKIDLEKTHVSLVEEGVFYRFEGGVRGHLYHRPGYERLLSFDEMEELVWCDIGAYFGEDFDRFMSGYLVN